MEIAIDLLSVLAFSCTISGNLMINAKNKYGFIIWTAGDVLWIAVELISGINLMRMMVFAVYILLNILGWRNWNRLK